MSLVSLRELENNPQAEDFSVKDNLDIFYAEDWNSIREAVQAGASGITTRKIKTGSCSVGGDLSTNELSSGGDVSVSGDVSLRKKVLFTEDVVSSGAVGNVVLNAHLHNTTDFSRRMPFTSIDGSTTSWVKHNHNNDGSAQIPTGAVTDDSLTFIKFNELIFGEGPGQILRGSQGTVLQNRTRAILSGDVASTVESPSIKHSPPTAFFIHSSSMGSLVTSPSAGNLSSRWGGELVSGDLDASALPGTELKHSYVANGGSATSSTGLNLNTTFSTGSANPWPQGPSWYGSRLYYDGGTDIRGIRYQFCLPENWYDLKIRYLYLTEADISGTPQNIGFACTFMGLGDAEASWDTDSPGSVLPVGTPAGTLLWAEEAPVLDLTYTSGSPGSAGIMAVESYVGTGVDITIIGAAVSYRTTILD